MLHEAVHDTSRREDESADRARVLVVEDEPMVARALHEGLEAEGYAVSVATDGESGLARGREGFDLIVLDLGLPKRDGLEVVAALRRTGIDTPILILTARDGVADRVAGLDRGADDYLPKPFAFSELVARVNAMLRRGRARRPPGPLTVGQLRLDPATRQATYAGATLVLTATEFNLLEHLARAQGQVVSREVLARDVWRDTARSSTLDNVIDVHVSRIRRKLGDGVGPALLHTVRGVGFVLREGM